MTSDNWLQSLMDGTAVDTVEIPNDLGEVTRLATALIEAQDEVKEAEASLKAKKDNLQRIQQDFLPKALEDLGLRELVLESGRKIRLKDFVNCSYDKANADQVFEWLREHEHDDIIKNVVSIAFAKGQDDLAQEFLDYARRWNHSPEVDVENNTSIHPQTLIKFAKTQMEAGEPLPEDLFTVYTGTKAEIK